MISIGEFSRICQVSIKTLRYYDKIGLMEPESVDEFTGYRYYSQGQMEQMLLIQRLKRYGFSLDEIKELLVCREKRALFSKLMAQREKLMKQQAEMAAVIGELTAHLSDFERTGDIMGYQKNYEIQLRETTDHPILISRQKMGVEDFGTYYSTIYERVPKAGVIPDGLVGAVYHDQEFSAECSDIELIVGVREKEKADRILQGGLCAMTVHHGPYSSLPDAYGAIVAWIDGSDFRMDGAPYEIYIKTQREGLPPEQWETEIYFPVKKRD